MNKNKFSILTARIILTLSITNFLVAQTDIKQDIQEKDTLKAKIENTIQKLNLKILLDNNQLEKVNKILINVFQQDSVKSNASDKINSINQQVEKILNNKQKSKFQILKSTWLNDLFDNKNGINSSKQ